MYQAHVLARLLEPRSIAVVGASPRPDAIGHVILRNVIQGGFAGKVWAVNPRHAEVLGQPCVASVEAIADGVDLAIATVAPGLLAEIVEQCGRAGIRHLIVVSNPQVAGTGGPRAAQRLRDTARKAGVRLLGPKSLGLMRPHKKLNATYTEIAPLAGEVALIAQSGAMCAAVVDWATGNGVGLSAAVALGTGLDIDFGEILDFLVHDDRTRYILLHVERVRDARGFMSALRS
jgi:acetyltransferase